MHNQWVNIFFVASMFATTVLCTVKRPIIQLSIPKCGTNLLRKCIEALTDKKCSFSYGLPDDSVVHMQQHTHFFSTHARYTHDNKEYLDSYDNPIVFFIYRDPRDQLISYIFWGDCFRPNNAHTLITLSLERIAALESTVIIPGDGVYYDFYKDLTFDELIVQLIFGGSAYYDGLGIYHPHYRTKGIADFYSSYLPWMTLPAVCAITFEDLIGPRGGGSTEKQLCTIRKIAYHLGVDVSEKQLRTIAQTIFGGSHTFREGQIGAWKKHFKEIHTYCFKQIAGQLLVDLGYENNYDW